VRRKSAKNPETRSATHNQCNSDIGAVLLRTEWVESRVSMHLFSAFITVPSVVSNAWLILTYLNMASLARPTAVARFAMRASWEHNSGGSVGKLNTRARCADVVQGAAPERGGLLEETGSSHVTWSTSIA
jgi:hypothetical protein